MPIWFPLSYWILVWPGIFIAHWSILDFCISILTLVLHDNAVFSWQQAIKCLLNTNSHLTLFKKLPRYQVCVSIVLQSLSSELETFLNLALQVHLIFHLDNERLMLAGCRGIYILWWQQVCLQLQKSSTGDILCSMISVASTSLRLFSTFFVLGCFNTYGSWYNNTGKGPE